MSIKNKLRRRWRAEGGYAKLFRVAIPLVISTGSWSIQHFVDGAFLTRHSAEAVAAVVPAGLLYWTILCIFSGTAHYVNTFVAQYTGARMDDKVGPAVWQGCFLALLSGVVMTFAIFLAKPLMALAGHPPDVQLLEVSYFKIICFAAGPAVLNSALSGFFTGRGDTRTVMWVTLAGTSVNIVLDYLLIFGKAGFPAMGIRGAALATVIGLSVCPLLYLLLIFRRSHRERYNTLRGFRFDPQIFRRLIKFGLPNGLHWCLDVLAFTIFIWIVGSLGTDQLAATNIAFRINSLAFMPMVGLGIAVSTLVGQYLGQNKPGWAWRAAYSAFHVTFLYMSLVAIAYVVFPHIFISVFIPNPGSGNTRAIAETVKILLRFVAIYTVFDSINVIFASAVKGAGDTRFVMWTTVSLAWLVMVVPTYLAVYVFDGGIYSAWWFLSAFVIIISAIFYLRFKGGKWESMRVIEMPPSLPLPRRASPGMEESLIEPPAEQQVVEGDKDE